MKLTRAMFALLCLILFAGGLLVSAYEGTELAEPLQPLIAAYENYSSAPRELTVEYLNTLSNRELNELAEPFRAIGRAVRKELGAPISEVYAVDEWSRNHLIYVLVNYTKECIERIAWEMSISALLNARINEILDEAYQAFLEGKINWDDYAEMVNVISAQSNIDDVESVKCVFLDACITVPNESTSVEYVEVEPFVMTRNVRIGQVSPVLHSVARLHLAIEVMQAQYGAGWRYVRYNLNQTIRRFIDVVLAGTVTNQVFTTTQRTTIQYVIELLLRVRKVYTAVTTYN